MASLKDGISKITMVSNSHSTQSASLDAGGKSSRLFVILLVAAMVAISAGVMVYVWRGRIAAQPGMLYVPEGVFLAGPDKKSTQLNAFFIDQTEVTNADFAEFCSVTSSTTPGCMIPAGLPDLPVVNVTVAQARAFAQWKGKRLPTQLEWERIARGVDGSRYPWGDAEDPSQANLRDNPKLTTHALMPVKSFQAEPAYQMAGNAWEMVEGNLTPSEAALAMFAKLLSPPPTAEEKWIEIRGGSFNTPRAAAVTYEWSPIPERYASADIGFRCAKSP
jgi:formylglycine-generating enzyme required for sulfatase activity